jgi:GNAT superfamily N-acetyltransferase
VNIRYVRPPYRGQGLGKQLLVHLAGLATERGCQRFEWSVLDRNERAIGFYTSLGAKPLDEWTTFRLDAAALNRLAAQAPE